MSKKLLSLILSILMVLSAFATTTVFATDNETEILGPEAGENILPEVAKGCNRYFFYQPESWRCEYSSTVGIYWWEGTGAQVSWPGIEAKKADAENVYYYDVPKDVEYFIWNNYVQFSPDQVVGPEYAATCRTFDLSLDGGKYSNMIFIVGEGEDMGFGGGIRFDGKWHNYYGVGEYDIYPALEDDCNRYFFYMPNAWCNEYTDAPGIYWNEGTPSHYVYPGAPLLTADAEGVYYYDVPKSVEKFYWTNLVDGGDDPGNIIYAAELKAPSYPYDMEESFDLSECNGKIFVVDFACVDYNEYDGRLICYGEWFYYYGNGEYGITPVRGDGEIYTENAFHDSKPEPIVLPYLVGDADNSGEVNVKDATAIQKHLADIQKCDIISGDVDNNGLNIKDATAIQKYIAGIEVDAPINTIGYK